MTSTHTPTAPKSNYDSMPQPQERDPLIPRATASARDPSFSSLGQWTKLSRAAKDLYRRNIGLSLIIGSQVFFALMNLAVKKLNSIDPPVTAFELVVVRMTITWLCSVAYMLATGVPDPFMGPAGVRLLLVFRGVSGCFGLIGLYISLQYLPLSDATVLTFLAPLCTAASGALFLHEKISRTQAFAGLLSLVGVILIARPPFIFGAGAREPVPPTGNVWTVLTKGATPEQRLLAVGASFIGVLGMTCAYTSLRAIGKRAHPLHSMAMFSFYSVLVASIGMIVTKAPFVVPTKLEWLGMLLMIGIFGFVSQLLLTMGLARVPVSRGSMAIYTQIVFASILERIFLKTVPSVLSVIGTLVILSCALYVTLTKESSPSSMEDDKTAAPVKAGEDDSLERGLVARANER